jgi:glutamate-1-semialdehyde 2,1-aminomutase
VSVPRGIQVTVRAGARATPARARELFPGGTTNTAVFPPGQELLVERGEGPWLYVSGDRRFLDFALGGGSLVLGHAHPRIIDAIERSARLGTQHFALTTRAVELAERIVQLVPSAEMVRFTASGSEATFHALRLARAATGRSGILKFDGGYHGHHDLAVWSFEHGDGAIPYPLPTPESAGVPPRNESEVAVVPFNDVAAVSALVSAEPTRFAAVICEPFQRALPPRPGFLEALRELCDRTSTVLIFDEIVTGFRFGPGGAQERYGVVPDLTALGKALAGGLPLAALVGREELMRHLGPDVPTDQRSFHCGTFNGYLLGVEAAHTTLDVLEEEDGYARLEELSQLAAQALERALSDSGVPAVVTRGGGLFQPYLTTAPVQSASDVRRSDVARLRAYHDALLQAGVYKLLAKGYVSLAHDESHIAELETATRQALAQTAEV